MVVGGLCFFFLHEPWFLFLDIGHPTSSRHPKSDTLLFVEMRDGR
jgi:hypothetical protein